MLLKSSSNYLLYSKRNKWRREVSCMFYIFLKIYGFVSEKFMWLRRTLYQQLCLEISCMFCISSKTYAFVNVTYKEIRKTCDKNYRSQFCFVWSEVSILPFKIRPLPFKSSPTPTKLTLRRAFAPKVCVGAGFSGSLFPMLLKGNMDTSLHTKQNWLR